MEQESLRTCAPYWDVQDLETGDYIIRNVSLADANAYVMRHREEFDLRVSRNSYWREPSPRAA